MFKQIVNPHSHSDGSLDGAATVKQIVQRNIDLGATHVALTEHGNINTSMDLYNACKSAGVKPILGIELYLESPFKEELRIRYEVQLQDTDPAKKAAKIEKKLRESYVHLTVHFKDATAYQHFCRMSPIMEARAVVRWGERKAIATWEEIEAIAGHITVCSSCLMGGVQKWILPWQGVSRPDLAEAFYLKARDLAGKDNFFVEVFPHQVTHDWKRPQKNEDGRITTPGQFVVNECTPAVPDGDLQKIANQFVMRMARKYGDPMLISLDSHFATHDQKVIQDARLGNGQEAWKFHNSYHIMSTDEAALALKTTLGVSDRDVEEMVDNSYRFASLFDGFKIQTSKDRWVLEPIADDYMVRLKHAIDRYGRMSWNNPEMVNRLKEEIGILAHNGKMNLLSYFFTVEDVANFCKENDVLMNVRGSAGGSLLLYLIGVSAVNPLKHDLSFGRFLTVGRIKANTLPDVDMDISDQEKVFEFLKERYGDRFCRISTDILLKIKSSIQDAERAALGKVRPETSALCHSLPAEPQGTDSWDFVFGHTDKDGVHHQGLMDTNPRLMAYSKNNADIWTTVCEMMGVQRQKSVHACGVVIADAPVQDYCPVITINKTRATGFSPKSVEAAGLVKYDFLGLNTLLDIQGCLRSIKERTGESIEWWNLPYDEQIYERFAAGRSETVFQFDTPTVRPYLVAIRPKSIEDLAAITSLCRPGCLDAPYSDGRTLAEVYVARSQGEPVQYVHPDLESITSITNGIQIYQEQTISIFKKLAGYSDEQSETVRRGIGKKDEKVLESCMGDLRSGCLSRGWTDQQVDLLKEQIMASARYAFNKSHAVSYAYVAYACMYLQVHYKLDWWKSVLSNATKNELVTKFWRYVHEFTSLPDINNSANSYRIVDEKLIAPLSIITGIGPKAYEQLVDKAPYGSLREFVQVHCGANEERSAVHSGVIRKLIAAGVLDSMFPDVPSGEEPLAAKIRMFEEVKADVKGKGHKVEPVPEGYRGITTLGRYMLMKELVGVFSADLRDFTMANRGGYKDQNDRWRLQRRSDQKDGTLVMSGDEIDRVREMAAKGMGWDAEFACLAYVISEKAKPYSNKTKQATTLMVDVGGNFYEEIFWPPWGESTAPSGFKGLPVVLVYRSQSNRFSLKKVIKLLRDEDKGRYDVV